MKAGILEKTAERSRDIDLESRFILSDEGISYCAQNKLLTRDVRTYDGSRKTGFYWQRFDAPLVQRMFVNRLIEEVDIQRTSLLDKRIALIDITKLLLYGMLYKKFKPELNQILLDSDILDRVLKPGMKNSLNANLQFNPAVVQRFVNEKLHDIQKIREFLLIDSYAMIDADKSITESERTDKKRIMRRFIDQVDNNTWFLFHFVNKSDRKFDIIDQINQTLMRYVEKTKIPEYVALMIMELVQNAEKAHYERLARSKKGVMKGRELDTMLRDAEFRELLSDFAQESNSFLNLNFSYSPVKLGGKDRFRFQFTLRNRGVILETKRRALQDKTSTGTAGVSLASFYNDHGNERLGAGLGLLYLSYLEEACRDVDIKIESRIVADSNRDETLTMVILYI